MNAWRAEYRVQAYRDQTGAWRDGYVVFEQQELRDTGETNKLADGYGGSYTERIYVARDGRRFRFRPSLDYGGQPSLIPEKAPNMVEGHWMRARLNTERCVSADGMPL